MLAVENLKVHLFTLEGVVKAVDGVSFSIKAGEVLGLVGESGCGKSMTALSLLRLVPNPPGKIISGRINFQGRDLLTLSEKETREIRGGKISMVFQEPATSLNPVWSIGDQLAEAVMIHQGKKKKEAKDEVYRLLDLVGIASAKERYEDYPHQLSGGLRQRVMIAMAISSTPDLLIADEPTTALDVTIQAQILDLLMKLKKDLRMSLLFITHDLGIISEIADRVAVMYAGRIIEEGDTPGVFSRPRHPYTRALFEVLPREDGTIKAIPGEVPHLAHLPAGCYFHPRCPKANDICRQKFPETTVVNPGHTVKCWNQNG